MSPLVTVIIPVFNRAKALSSALRSVAEQTFTDWEVVVVDDASSDESAEAALQVAPRDKVRVIRHAKNLGSSAARNTGISAARGRYVAFLDSDDSWHPEKLRKQVELVERDPDPSNVFCTTQSLVHMAGGRVRVRPERAPAAGEDWSEFLYVSDEFAQTNTFFLSRQLAERILFNPNLHGHVDSLFFLEAGALGARYRLIEEPLSIWNHDSRADRVSLSPSSLQHSRDFLATSGRLFTEKARLAFEVRYLGPLLFKENPVAAIRLFRAASRSGVVVHRHMLATCARCVLPPSAVSMLQRGYYALAG
jgi:glycosyltransferase involved in cell wall biosynthesis